jgi:hypothetical protein
MLQNRMKLINSTLGGEELEIHWLSIMNSLVLVVLLTAFVALIVSRVLSNDYSRYSKLDADVEGIRLHTHIQYAIRLLELCLLHAIHHAMQLIKKITVGSWCMPMCSDSRRKRYQSLVVLALCVSAAH